MGAEIVVGYDVETNCVGKIKMDILTHVHGALVGSSGSGKSIALLYLIYQLLSIEMPIEITICDPKSSGDFVGIVPPDNFATGIKNSVMMIDKFYESFLNTCENNNKLQLLLIDEYPGLINTIPDLIGGKEGKAAAERLKSKIASIFMMSRSKRMGIWLIMQRPSASLFNTSISNGCLDNLMFVLNMGKLYTQTHVSLFANERLQNEEFAATYHPSCGSGYFLQDGQPLKAIRIPLIRDKAALTKLLQKKARDKWGNF